MTGKCSSSNHSQKPMKAPTTPTMRSPMRPKPAPLVTLPASQPATRPTAKMTIRLFAPNDTAMPSLGRGLRPPAGPAHFALKRNHDTASHGGGQPPPFGQRRTASLAGGKDREQKRCLAHFCCTAASAAADWQTSDGLSMIPKKPARDVIRGGHRFPEMIMLQQ